jgi:hypothetical protein
MFKAQVKRMPEAHTSLLMLLILMILSQFVVERIAPFRAARRRFDAQTPCWNPDPRSAGAGAAYKEEALTRHFLTRTPEAARRNPPFPMNGQLPAGDCGPRLRTPAFDPAPQNPRKPPNRREAGEKAHKMP